MLNPGVYNLGDRTIAAALTDETITIGSAGQELISRLEGMVSVSLQARLVYGSGGTSIACVVQTSLDQGTTWIDICRFDFATANALKIANISAAGAVAPGAVAALGSEGKLDGILGDRLRCVVTSVGTYAGNTTLSVRAVPR